MRGVAYRPGGCFGKRSFGSVVANSLGIEATSVRNRSSALKTATDFRRQASPTVYGGGVRRSRERRENGPKSCPLKPFGQAMISVIGVDMHRRGVAAVCITRAKWLVNLIGIAAHGGSVSRQRGARH
jgi:hypothetical protein